ncbi:MAG: glycosyltransferase, partial [Rhizobacter sp.]|nr:glycosyltransferase [Rhizobacter sp.]
LAQPSAPSESSSAVDTALPSVAPDLGKRATVGGPRSNRRGRLPSVSCVVPCLNEVTNLALLLPVLRRELMAHASAWEIVVVDDGSTDATADLLESWANLPGIRSIQFSRNFGKEAALTAGMQATTGDVVVLLDADMQHPPALIGSMIERWQGGADVVYAVRESRVDEPAFKRFGARLFYSMLNASARTEVPAGAGDFRLMDRAAVDAILSLPERNRFMKGLYAWVGFNAVPLPYMPADRATGTTKFSPLKLLGLSVDGLTAFTTWPLRMVSLGGIALAVPAFIYGAFLVFDYFFDRDAVNGWTTIVVTLMLFLGIQMISLGILGEYIARIFEEVKGRPLFIVKRKLGQSLDEAPSTAGREVVVESGRRAMRDVAGNPAGDATRDTAGDAARSALPAAARDAVQDALE